MKVGDLVAWNDSGKGRFHLFDHPAAVHDDHVNEPEKKKNGIVIEYFGDTCSPASPDSDGYVRVLWNDGDQTVTSVGLLMIISKGTEEKDFK